MDSNQSYGAGLPDQVDKISSLSEAQLELIGDVRDLYKELVTLEREFASKLQQLAKKAVEKKAKKITAVVVGNTPTKAYDDVSIGQSTLERAYSQLLTSLSDSAQDHADVADALNLQVIEALKATEKKHEETNKRQMQYFQKLLSDREKVYADRLKTKQKYDEECVEVELYRQKQERSSDDRHADRAARQYEQQQSDMLNGKNVYILSTALANSAKSKYFNEDLPALENASDLLQQRYKANSRKIHSNSTQALTKFSTIILRAQDIQNNHLNTLKSRVSATEDAFKSLNPSQDQNLFIEYNVSHFAEPPDWSFEPCSTHYDTSDMSVEPAPKVYLQNRLARCKEKLQELQPIIASKRKEVDQLHKLVQTYTENKSPGDTDGISDNYLEADHQLTFFTTSERMLLTEIETISSVLGGDEGTQCPHSFKSSSFSIPTQCAYCKSSIWGLSKQGKTCKSCGISVHNKCELKVPADCPGSKESGRHSSTPSISTSYTSLSRSGSTASTSSALVTPSPSSFAQSDPSSAQEEDTYPAARVVFDFTPTSPFELSVTEGAFVHILEEDDGSGWVKVADESGRKGLVPASYVELVDIGSQHHKPDIPAKAFGSGRPQGSGKYVRAIYDYQAQGSDEINMKDGQLLELTGGPSGGQNYADGWWEGLDSNGRKGIFPSNYVEPVP